MDMSERIKTRRIFMGFTQEELGEKLGLQKSAIAKYENGRVENIKRSIIANMAKVLDCSPAYLMGWDEDEENISYNKDSSSAITINVLGRVAAGIPIEAVEEIIDTEEISQKMASTGEFFGLQIHGDSMEPRMCEGDVVIVRKQDDAESGDIVIALVNGNDATCKRLMKYTGGISLIALNSKYEPLMFSNDDIQKKPVRILGKVIELRGKF